MHPISLIKYSQGGSVCRPLPRTLRVRIRLLSQVLVLFAALGILAGGIRAEPAKKPMDEDRVLAQYLEKNQEQRATLRDVSMTVDIEAKLPDLEKKGALKALRNVSKLGKITYKVLGFQGDNMVKKDVIARYIEAEVKSSDMDTRNTLAINTNNYKFNYWGRYGDGDWVLDLFELKPRKKRLGLYKGWLWINAKTGMPVRESGRLVKNPSVFLKRVDSLKDYEMVDGVAVPSKIESQILTRLIGTAEITIHFKDISFTEKPQVASSQLGESRQAQ